MRKIPIFIVSSESRRRIVELLSGGLPFGKGRTPDAANVHADKTQVSRRKNEVARPFGERSNPLELAQKIIEAFAA